MFVPLVDHSSIEEQVVFEACGPAVLPNLAFKFAEERISSLTPEEVVRTPALPLLVLLMLPLVLHWAKAFCEQLNKVIAVRTINMPRRGTLP